MRGMGTVWAFTLLVILAFSREAQCVKRNHWGEKANHDQPPEQVDTNGRPFPVPKMTSQRTDVRAFEYIDVGPEIPDYRPGERRGTRDSTMTLMQKPLTPEESLKHIITPRGFHVELYASEPDIGGKPICMTWDERGRLWVAETYDYPNELQSAGKGRDRIRICEDTDGDWKADKFTVFADKLSIPTSIVFHRGGAIVHDGTRTLYLKDTNGDDVADSRTVLFTGWNQGDTHGGVSNFQYGLDNWVWAMQGYNHSHPNADGKIFQDFRMGFFRFLPDGSHVEFLRSTNNNTWGLGISEEGIAFASTANRNPSVYMPIPNRYYERVRGWTPSLVLGTIADTHLFKPITDKVRQVDHHGGYTAAAGHALYTARTYPKEYWNRVAFVNGPTGHLVGTFLLQRNGSDFRSSNPFNLFASDDEWTAPIMAEVGPDGNVWVIDWYNFIVQHNPTPQGFTTGKGSAYETKLRDKKHGRIYRVVFDTAPTPKPISLAGASPSQLVNTLAHENMLWRKHAQRLLVERGDQDILADLIQLASSPRVDPIGLNVGVVHALWTMHGLGTLDGSYAAATETAIAALKHASAGVRCNALKVLPMQVESSQAVLASGVLTDPNAQVRLAGLLALADLPPIPAAGPAIVSAINAHQNQSDRWIPDAATSAAARNCDSFLDSLTAAARPSDKMIEIATIVSEHYARGGPVDSVAAVVARLAKVDASIADAVVRGMAKGWPKDKAAKLDAQRETELEQLLARLSPGTRGLLVRLAYGWGSTPFERHARQVSDTLLKQVDDHSLDEEKRIQAARHLIEFSPRDTDVVIELLDRISPQASPRLATGIVDALLLSESPCTGQLIVKQFRGLTPSTQAVCLTVLLSRPESSEALLDGAERGDLRLSRLPLDQKQALANHPDKTIRNRARRLLDQGGASPDPNRQKVLTTLLPITKKAGDPVAGKIVFKRECEKCHMHRGEGTEIGPDLTGMAVSPKNELLTFLIDPSRNVEGNFRVYTVTTVDGRVLNGLLASESKTAIELFDAEGKKLTVLREDIDELMASTKSLMPDGFEKQVTRGELTNLLEFLTQRGKYVPIDLRKAATITSVCGMFSNKNAEVERMIFPDWSPKTFRKIPFHLVNPRDGLTPNIILLNGPNGPICPTMPKTVDLPCNQTARAIHFLSGVSGWGYPIGRKGTTSLIVRLHYVDGLSEDHELKNGIHFADYIRHVDVPGSELAFMLRNQQLRYLAVLPRRSESIRRIQLIKGDDHTSPMVIAVTVESR